MYTYIMSYNIHLYNRMILSRPLIGIFITLYRYFFATSTSSRAIMLLNIFFDKQGLPSY